MQFMNTKKAQQIINDNLDKPYAPPPSRNPIYDLREEGQDFYPLDPPVTPVVDDPCPEGYQLIDGVCQPIEQFNPETNYADQNDNRDNDEVEERPYMSIEDMKNADDFELLSYLSDGRLANSNLGFLPSKLGEEFFLKKPFPNTLTMGLGLLGLNNEKNRRDFMMNELAKRGYNLDTQQGQLGLTQAMGIINNAQSSNLGFTPEEINYQIDAKNQAQNIVNQGGNPYANTMTQQQVIDNAINSGASSVNPFEQFGINQSTPSNQSSYAFNNITNPADDYDDESSGI